MESKSQGLPWPAEAYYPASAFQPELSRVEPLDCAGQRHASSS